MDEAEHTHQEIHDLDSRAGRMGDIRDLPSKMSGQFTMVPTSSPHLIESTSYLCDLMLGLGRMHVVFSGSLLQSAPPIRPISRRITHKEIDEDHHSGDGYYIIDELGQIRQESRISLFTIEQRDPGRRYQLSSPARFLETHHHFSKNDAVPSVPDMILNEALAARIHCFCEFSYLSFAISALASLHPFDLTHRSSL